MVIFRVCYYRVKEEKREKKKKDKDRDRDRDRERPSSRGSSTPQRPAGHGQVTEPPHGARAPNEGANTDRWSSGGNQRDR